MAYHLIIKNIAETVKWIDLEQQHAYITALYRKYDKSATT